MDKYQQIIDALSMRLGVEDGKDMYDRVIELYELCKQLHLREASAEKFEKELNDWWKRGK